MTDKNLNRWFLALALAGGLIIGTDSRADSMPPRVSQWPVGLDMGPLSPVPTDDAHIENVCVILANRLVAAKKYRDYLVRETQPKGFIERMTSQASYDDRVNRQSEKIEKGQLQRLELKCNPMYPNID
jgi:hypothetical protein